MVLLLFLSLIIGLISYLIYTILVYKQEINRVTRELNQCREENQQLFFEQFKRKQNGNIFN